MKICKKLLVPFIALVLCFMTAFAMPVSAVPEDGDKVTAQPTDPAQPTNEGTDIGEIVGDVIGEVDPEVGEDIRDTVDEAEGILSFFTELLDKISALLGDFLNSFLKIFYKDKLFG